MTGQPLGLGPDFIQGASPLSPPLALALNQKRLNVQQIASKYAGIA